MNPNGLSHERDQWVKWLQTYGADKFYDAFMETAQDAESRCKHCRRPIYLDILEGGGVPDWRTDDGDYGCSARETDDGADSHTPRTKRT